MALTVTILGCGTSSGVPIPGLGWGACDPDNPKNRRMRVSILLQHEQTNFLIDAGPDLREQLLLGNVKHLDGLMITHAHADHIHGLDDLRWINNAMGRDIPCFADEDTLAQLKQRFAYIFEPLPEGQASYHKPVLLASPISAGSAWDVHGLSLLPILQFHGKGHSLGVRVNNFAYCTDVHDFPEGSWQHLQGITHWVVDCLGYNPHVSHAHLDRVLAWVEKLQPQQTYLAHMNAALDYETLIKELPAHIAPAYDGLQITIT